MASGENAGPGTVQDWTSKRALAGFLGGLCKIFMVEVFAELVRVRCLSQGMYEVVINDFAGKLF